MFSFPLLKKTACVLVLSISLWTCGCVATTYVKAGDMSDCENCTIKIITPGGTEYHFRTWSVGESSVASSEAEIHRPSMTAGFWGTTFEPFSGSVPFDSISQCSCEKANLTTTIIGIVGVSAILAWIARVSMYGPL